MRLKELDQDKYLQIGESDRFTFYLKKFEDYYDKSRQDSFSYRRFRFIATHCILKLAAAGYKIKSTVRNLDRVSDLNKILDEAGSTYERLNKIDVDWVSADLTIDEGWSEAVKGCDYVMHVASPVALEEPKDENDLIVPAEKGLCESY